MTQESRRAATVVVSLILAVLVLGYALAAYLSRAAWNTHREGTRAVYVAKTQDGTTPSAEVMSKAVDVAKKRLRASGISDAEVTADGGSVVVVVPGRGTDTKTMQNLFTAGQLYIRPVIQSMPAKTPQTPAPPAQDGAQRVAKEKKLRQSTNPQLQILALDFEAGRCGEPDALAGKDDPDLPLVTCSTDGKTAYLLDRSILSGKDIQNATSELDQGRGIYVVELEFSPSAAKTWADFTSHAFSQGTQTAFTLDTRVVSAPSIREPIQGGKVEVGGSFTEQSARDLAAGLGSGALPVSLSFVSSTTETLPATAFVLAVRVAVVGVGILLAIAVAAAAYLLRRHSRRDFGA